MNPQTFFYVSQLHGKYAGEIEAFCQKHHYPDFIMETAIDLAKRALESEEFIGKNPKGIRAAVLYIASRMHEYRGWRYSQRYISLHNKITENTLRIRYQELVKLFEIELKDW